MTCSEAECSRACHAKGLCRSHYDKALKARNGDYRDRQLASTRKWIRENPDRARAVALAWRSRQTPEARRDRMLRSMYGITEDQYRDQLARQRGLCLLCEKPGKRMMIDHDHATGKLRGILCSRCNNGLGFFDDDPAFLRRAATYLEALR